MTRFSLLGALAALSLPSVALAQAVPGTPYVLFSQPQAYADLTSPTVLFTNVLTDTADIQLPFPFLFYDTTYTGVSFGTDGAILFGAGLTVSNVNATPGSTSTPNAWIAPYWDTSQFCTADNGHLAYQIQGSAPDRVAVFEWKRLNIGACTPADLVSFQVRLHEGPAGRIEIDYGPSVALSSASATMAMEDSAGARPILFRSPCTTSCTGSDFTALSGTRLTVVQDAGVDVEIASVSAPAFLPIGVPRTIDVTVTNHHGEPTGDVTVRVLASPDGTVASGVASGSATVDVPPYASATVPVTVEAPLSLGMRTYDLLVVADPDDTLAEVEEDNNVLVATTRFIPPNPDLVVEAVSIDRTSANAGDPLQVTARIANQGIAMTAPVAIGAFLSTNAAVSAVDLELGTQSIMLGTNEVVRVVFDLTVPANIASGQYTIGVVADPQHGLAELSRSNNVGAAPDPIDIHGAGVAIVSSRLPTARVGFSYDATIQTLGGEGSLTFTKVSGVFPTGIALVAATGELYGRPSAVGCEDVTIQVADGVGTDVATFTLCVADPGEPLTVVTRSLATGVVGQEYVGVLVAVGGAAGSAPEWSAEGLPASLAVEPTGRIVGTPFEVGEFDVTLIVTDGVSTARRVITLVVVESNQTSLVAGAPPVGRIGESYAHTFEATGGIAPYVYTVDFGALPPGLTLDPSGVLEGTPRVAGSFYFGLRVRDSATSGVPGRDVDAITVVIRDDEGLEIATTSLPEGVAGEGYSASVEAMGGFAPYTWDIVEGSLPEGLLSNVEPVSGTLMIVGTPEVGGIASLLVRVSDREGRTAQRALSIRVLDEPVVVDTPEPSGCTAAGGATAAWWVPLLAVVAWVGRRRR